MAEWQYHGGDFGEPVLSSDSKDGIISLAMRSGILIIQSRREGVLETIQLDTRNRFEEITLVSEDIQDRKSTSAVMALAGLVVAGPLGVLAGLAAPKKKTAVFWVSLKSDSPQDTGGKKLLIETSKDNYVKVLRFSGLTGKALASANEGAQQDVAGQLEKLASLRERGLIDEDEYSAAKAKLL